MGKAVPTNFRQNGDEIMDRALEMVLERIKKDIGNDPCLKVTTIKLFSKGGKILLRTHVETSKLYPKDGSDGLTKDELDSIISII